MKSYTDIEQSKKLVEILPLESSDMMYHSVENEYGSGAFVATSKIITNGFKNDDFYYDDIPCWSLAALLNVLNTIEGWYPGIDAQVGEELNWQICMFSYKTGSDLSTAAANKELVDTCYEVILKLYENKIL